MVGFGIIVIRYKGFFICSFLRGFGVVVRLGYVCLWGLGEGVERLWWVVFSLG